MKYQSYSNDPRSVQKISENWFNSRWRLNISTSPRGGGGGGRTRTRGISFRNLTRARGEATELDAHAHDGRTRRERVQQKRMTKNFQRSTEPRERKKRRRVCLSGGAAEYLKYSSDATSLATQRHICMAQSRDLSLSHAPLPSLPRTHVQLIAIMRNEPEAAR